MDQHAQAFAEIYANNAWGGATPSGPGSETRFNDAYLQLVQTIVNRPEVRSVLDIGCGDWNLGRQIDWSSVNYLGVDVVANMINRNIDCFSRDNISFRCLNGVDGKIAPVDLVIIKDVMQHLSNADVLKMLKNLSKHTAVLITNDVACRRPAKYRDPSELPPPANADIAAGTYRPVQLDRSPFSLSCELLLSYEVPCETMIFNKEVVLWTPATRHSVVN